MFACLTQAGQSLRSGGLVGVTTNGGQHSKGQHDQRDVTMPAMPGSSFVMIKSQLGLGSLEAVLDGTAAAFNRHQCLEGRASRAPGGKICQALVGEAAPDQQTACPDAAQFGVEFVCLQVGEFQTGR